MDTDTLVAEHVENRRTLTDISEELGVSREAVRQRMRRAGVSPEITKNVLREHYYEVRKCAVCDTTFEVKKSSTKKTCGEDSCIHALRATGLLRYTDEELISSLQRLAAEVGRTPTMYEINSDARTASHSTYVNRFGSLTDAQKAAGLEPNERGGAR